MRLPPPELNSEQISKQFFSLIGISNFVGKVLDPHHDIPGRYHPVALFPYHVVVVEVQYFAVKHHFPTLKKSTDFCLVRFNNPVYDSGNGERM